MARKYKCHRVRWERETYSGGAVRWIAVAYDRKGRSINLARGWRRKPNKKTRERIERRMGC